MSYKLGSSFAIGLVAVEVILANALFVTVCFLLENPLSNSQVPKVSLVLVYPMEKCV